MTLQVHIENHDMWMHGGNGAAPSSTNYPLIQNDYFRIIFGGSTGKSCKSPRGYYRGGALTGQGPIQETIFGELWSGALQENPVIAPGAIT